MASLKMSQKEEIMFKTLEKLGHGGIYDFDKSAQLLKFMLFDDEHFGAAIKYFSKADRINFRDYGLDICVKNATHCFGYDWNLMDELLQICLPSISHLCVSEDLKHEKSYKFLDMFLKNDIKYLTLCADFTESFMNILKKEEYKFEIVHIEHHRGS